MTGSSDASVCIGCDFGKYSLVVGASAESVCSACSDPWPLAMVDRGNPPPPNLGECEGECDSDNDCAAGLVCWQRGWGEHTPGCQASSNRWSDDYCSAGLSAAEQATYSESFTGYCEHSGGTGYLRLYEGGDNPMGVQGCAFACMSRTRDYSHGGTDHDNTWNMPMFEAVTGFIVKSTNGRCYCSAHDHSTCARTETSGTYTTYDFVRSPHSKRYR